MEENAVIHITAALPRGQGGGGRVASRSSLGDLAGEAEKSVVLLRIEPQLL